MGPPTNLVRTTGYRPNGEGYGPLLVSGRAEASNPFVAEESGVLAGWWSRFMLARQAANCESRFRLPEALRQRSVSALRFMRDAEPRSHPLSAAW